MLTLTGIAWLSQSLRFVEMIIDYGLSIKNFLLFSVLILPNIVWIILPLALFAGIAYVYNRLYANSELVIFSSTGMSRGHVARPAILFAFIALILSYFIGFYLSPLTQEKFRDLRSEMQRGGGKIVIKPETFVNQKGITLYVKNRDSDGNMYGIFFQDDRKEDRQVTMMAARGRFYNGNSARFYLEDGTRQERDLKTGKLSLLNFDSYNLTIELEDVDEETFVRKKKAKELSFNELIEATDNDKVKAELAWRFFYPLYLIIITFLALMPFLRKEFTRHEKTKEIALYSLLSLLILISAFMLKSSVAKNPDLIFLWGVKILALSIFLPYKTIKG